MAGTASYSQSIIVAGLVRNAARTMRREIHWIQKRLSAFKSLEWVIVESDSEDQTASELLKLSSEISNFTALSLGNLERVLPDRLDRIAFCRNAYLDYIRENLETGDDVWILVMDLDGINKKFPSGILASLLDENLSDAHFANQNGPYYDLAALRHKTWNPTDPHLELEQLISEGLPPSLALDLAIFRKMVKIPRASKAIRVDSAFGGLALYRSSVVGESRYSSRTREGLRVCEHVPFHAEFSRNSKLGLHIQPSLINARYTEHTRLLAPVRRFCQPLVAMLRKFAFAILRDEIKVESAYKRSRSFFPWL